MYWPDYEKAVFYKIEGESGYFKQKIKILKILVILKAIKPEKNQLKLQKRNKNREP